MQTTKKVSKMLTIGMFGIVLAFGLMMSGCAKKTATGSGKKTLKVDAVKITDDIDSSFKVQAATIGDNSGSGNGDLGIVGKIEDGKLTINIPVPSEDQLHDPSSELDLGESTEGLKITQLEISTSKAVLSLDNPQSGGYITIWYANKDGTVEFTGYIQNAMGYSVTINNIAFKQGWNYVESFDGTPIPEAQVWADLKDVYEKGFYKWILTEK